MSNERGNMTSVGVRQDLVETLRLDLIGPDNDHAFVNELLPESPTRWYLTGLLVPTDAPIAQKFDENSTEEVDSPAEPGGVDDAEQPDKPAARRSLLPSSMGLSMLVPSLTKTLKAAVMWGDYVYESPDGQDEPAETTEAKVAGKDAAAEKAGQEAAAPKGTDGDQGGKGAVDASEKGKRGYRRKPQTQVVTIKLPEPGDKPTVAAVPHSDGLVLVTTVRSADTANLPLGTRAVSVFLVNSRTPDTERPYRRFVFQATLEVACDEGFVARPDPRAWGTEGEWDQRVADVQYRDAFEFAVGHGVSVEPCQAQDGACKIVRTTWIPRGEVERVAPAQIPNVELNMEALGELKDAAEAKTKLDPLVTQYKAWITSQQAIAGSLEGNRKSTAHDMLQEAGHVADRIQAGIDLLADEEVLLAFRVANRAVAKSARQRFGRDQGKAPETVDPPCWRPFQLAFLLMTMRGVAQPTHGDREVVDLLFFPTGGGKTEAYLGLAAFALVLRRLRNKGIRSAGVSVLMRYTLRLLTLDQLSRAAALICALELERQQLRAVEKDPVKRGRWEWPFEIGLWVGQAATPNRMGCRGDTSRWREYTAYTKTTRFLRDDRQPSPIPIEDCPWCGTKFDRNSFRLVPNPNQPADLQVHCANHKCIFHGDRHLPIVAVDEPIYRRLPCFMIATVDKFAALPWTGETGLLLGKADRYDQHGFYGPCEPAAGHPIPEGQLPPPDLIIQDELHLISGPLGTVAGLYETAIDALATREVNGHNIRPKIIASTATVRRAELQIQALFDRRCVSVFPSPGPDRRDSFFAKTLSSAESPARLYVGVAAQGRSLKVVLLRTALALLSAGQRLWDAAGGAKIQSNPADPYMTLLGYFNSLRELGGSRRIIEDEVRTRLGEYGRRRRREPDDKLFCDRSISYEVLELTSRVSTNDVATAKRRLALGFAEKERVDVALATNMISVGLDIMRLGLMVVLGQPKTTAEYIQATSRVGRAADRSGLVVTLLNIHKPRDRSHYERFAAYHNSFYRNVEATSVTPFSPRALDRALPAALVGLCRHGQAELTAPGGARDILVVRDHLELLAQRIADRAGNHKDMDEAERRALTANVLHRCNDLLDDWLRIAKKAQEEGSGMQYQREINKPPRRLLYEFLHPDLPSLPPIQQRFRANRSMRDVEPSVDILVKNLNDWGDSK
jgi:hypothetical protein